MAVPGVVPNGIREPKPFCVKGRRTRAVGLLHCRCGSLRTSGMHTDADGIRPMSAVLAAGVVASPCAADRHRLRCRCDGCIPSRVADDASRDPKSEASLLPPSNLVHASDHVDCILPPEPEEHADRSAHGVDVRRRVPFGPTGLRGGLNPSRPRGQTRLTLFKVDLSFERPKKALHNPGLPPPWRPRDG